MTLALETRGDGVVLPVKAQAGARKNGLCGVHNGELRVAVTQAAEKGKANKAILELLADRLDLRRGQLELIAGELSAHKRVLVRAIDAEALRRAIETAESA